MSASECKVLRFTGPERVTISREPLPEPDENEVRVRTRVSAVSPGTEKLVYRGEAPKAQGADLTIPSLEGGLEYPLQYGYAAVGHVEETGRKVSDDWMGRRVFSFQPHASHFVAAPENLIQIPDEVSDSDAAMIPSVETAVNLCMDGAPSIGDRTVVFGQGTVGLLTTQLLARHPLSGLFTVEPDDERRRLSREKGADATFAPEKHESLRRTLGIEHSETRPIDGESYEGADLLYELSGEPEVLDDALRYAGFASTIIVGSWYGTREARLDLGSRFHRARVTITSSQVSTIAPEQRGRWSKERRMAHVLKLLPELEPHSLISNSYPIDEAAKAYEELNRPDEGLTQPVFRYP